MPPSSTCTPPLHPHSTPHPRTPPPGTRVALDMTTLTIMRALPREVDPMVFNMLQEDPGKVRGGRALCVGWG